MYRLGLAMFQDKTKMYFTEVNINIGVVNSTPLKTKNICQ